MRPSALRSAMASSAAALPWCCIAPAALSVSGAAVAGAGVGLRTATPLFLLVSVAFLGRALYLSLIRRQGRPWTRAVTLVSALAVSLLGGFRTGLWTL